jgi:molecular chaperone GrpE (heat shock protein)
MDARIVQLEEEIEDLQNENATSTDKIRKFQADIEKLTNDLLVEKSNVAKSEVNKLFSHLFLFTPHGSQNKNLMDNFFYRIRKR